MKKSKYRETHKAEELTKETEVMDEVMKKQIGKIIIDKLTTTVAGKKENKKERREEKNDR